MIDSIQGVDAVKSLEGVLHIQLLVSAGQAIKRPKNGAQRHGFAILAAADNAALQQLQETVNSTLQVRYAG